MSHPQKAEQLLSDATDGASAAASTTDVRLWLKWAELSHQMMETLGKATGVAPSLPPVSILRRALKQTLIHDMQAYLSILTELMYHLMETRKKKNDNTNSDNSEKVAEELKQLFQKLSIVSQGSAYSIPNPRKRRMDEIDHQEDKEDTVNIAATFLAYLKYTMDNISSNSRSDASQNNSNATRFIYTSVLYHSTYRKSCNRKDPRRN